MPTSTTTKTKQPPNKDPLPPGVRAVDLAAEDAARAMLAEIDLADAPALVPAGTLRVGQRQPFLSLAMQVEQDADSDGNVDPYTQLTRIVEMDESLEKVAVDPTAYAAWAIGKDVEMRVMALFMRYAGELGEAERSTS